jgi:hypothetical protein
VSYDCVFSRRNDNTLLRIDKRKRCPGAGESDLQTSVLTYGSALHASHDGMLDVSPRSQASDRTTLSN